MGKEMMSPSPTQLKQLLSSQLGVLPQEQFFSMVALLPSSTPGMFRPSLLVLGSSGNASESRNSTLEMFTVSDCPSSRLS